MAATRLQAARRQRDNYTQQKAVRDLLALARARNVPVMSEPALKTKISVWENGHERVSEPYRSLFRELYGRTNEELGFPLEAVDEDTEQLRDRLALARSVDAESIALFRQQIDNARRVDRKHGAVTVLDQLRSQIEQIQGLLNYSTMHGEREGLAAVLAEASALAGWDALDRNALAQAWRYHEIAKTAAREANSRHLLVHATAQQAFILIDLGELEVAVRQLAAVREAAKSATPLVRAWLAAAHGEALAAAHRRNDALRAFDGATAQLPVDPTDSSLGFLFLAGAHLDRWRGHALSRLGEPEAMDQLADALPRLPPDFTRARSAMLVDLAFAHAAAGDRDAALDYSRQAKRLASQIKSDRQLRRLSGLVLPT